MRSAAAFARRRAAAKTQTRSGQSFRSSFSSSSSSSRSSSSSSSSSSARPAAGGLLAAGIGVGGWFSVLQNKQKELMGQKTSAPSAKKTTQSDSDGSAGGAGGGGGKDSSFLGDDERGLSPLQAPKGLSDGRVAVAVDGWLEDYVVQLKASGNSLKRAPQTFAEALFWFKNFHALRDLYDSDLPEADVRELVALHPADCLVAGLRLLWGTPESLQASQMMRGFHESLIGFASAVFAQYPARIVEWYVLMRCPTGAFFGPQVTHPDSNLWYALFLSETPEAQDLLGVISKEIADRRAHNGSLGAVGEARADQQQANFQLFMSSMEPQRLDSAEMTMRATGEFLATGDPAVIARVCTAFDEALRHSDPQVRQQAHFLAQWTLVGISGVCGDSARMVLQQQAAREDLTPDMRALITEFGLTPPEKAQELMEEMLQVNAMAQQR